MIEYHVPRTKYRPVFMYSFQFKPTCYISMIGQHILFFWSGCDELKSTQPGHPSVTSDSFGVNMHTVRRTRPVSVFLWCKLLSDLGLRKQWSARRMGLTAQEGLLYGVGRFCTR